MYKACSVEPNVRDQLHLKSHWPSRRRDASTFTALPGSRKIHASLSFLYKACSEGRCEGPAPPRKSSPSRWRETSISTRTTSRTEGKREGQKRGYTANLQSGGEGGYNAFWQRSGSAREKASMALQYRKTKVNAAGKETDIKLL